MARFTILLLTLATLTGFAYRTGYMKGEDETITVSIPKGYSAPTPIPKDGWEDRMKQIMAHGLESEAHAAEGEVADASKPDKVAVVAKPAPKPSMSLVMAESKVRPRRTLTTKAGRNHGHKSVGRTGRGRHGRHAR